MQKLTFQDCYVQWNDTTLAMGNSKIERTYHFYRQHLVPVCIIDKCSGYAWQRDDEAESMPLDTPLLDESLAELTVAAEPCSNGGLSEDFFQISITYQDKECAERRFVREFSIFPELPFISMGIVAFGQEVYGEHMEKKQEKDFNGVETAYASQEKSRYLTAQDDCIDTFPLPKGHYKMHEVKLMDKSDIHDFLVQELTEPMYSYGWSRIEVEGNIFQVEDYVHGRTLMLIKEAPTHLSALNHTGVDLYCSTGKVLQMVGTGLKGQRLDKSGVYGYGCTVGTGTPENMLALYRAFYRANYRGNQCGHTYIMSNTWGDCHNDTVVSHDFIMGEIDVAARMGVDAVQIDDGWEKGTTSNSALQKNGVWEGYYAYDPDFWQMNQKKFPQGLAPLVEYAKSKGVEIALWFSPDSSHDFANMQKDIDTLLYFYRTYGIRYFKLDGVKIRSKIGERNYLKFLEEVSRQSNNEIGFNQDITAEDRLGHVYFKQFGTLFVENRYTDRGSYYPHNVLKNLWQLSRYFPACKFQFEALNNRRNREVYGDDPFAPGNYTMDYIFATTMMANPLIWMEMSFLANEDVEVLSKIMAVYKAHREALFHADISPIGQMPDGQSYSGFLADCGRDQGYFLLFREAAKEKSFAFCVPSLAGKRLKLELLAHNGTGAPQISDAVTAEGQLKVTMPEQRSYAFIRYQIDDSERS